MARASRSRRSDRARGSPACRPRSRRSSSTRSATALSMPREIAASIWPKPSRVIAATILSPSPSVRSARAIPCHFPSGKNPVLEITRAATASGCSHAQRRPIRPPQSWTTSASRSRPSPSRKRSTASTWRSQVPGGSGRRVAEAGEVRRDGAPPRLGQGGDHVSPHERGLRKAVQAERRDQVGVLGRHGLAIGDPVDACRLHLDHESGPYRAPPQPRRVSTSQRFGCSDVARVGSGELCGTEARRPKPLMQLSSLIPKAGGITIADGPRDRRQHHPV